MRLATGLMVLFLIAHTLGTVTTTSRGPAEDAALAALAAFRFDVMGVTRSHADFYFGLGLCLSAALVLVVWISMVATRLIAEGNATGPTLSRALAVTTGLIAAISWWWIFPAPAVMSTAAAAAYAWAGFSKERS